MMGGKRETWEGGKVGGREGVEVQRKEIGVYFCACLCKCVCVCVCVFFLYETLCSYNLSVVKAKG